MPDEADTGAAPSDPVDEALAAIRAAFGASPTTALLGLTGTGEALDGAVRAVATPIRLSSVQLDEAALAHTDERALSAALLTAVTDAFGAARSALLDAAGPR